MRKSTVHLGRAAWWGIRAFFLSLATMAVAPQHTLAQYQELSSGDHHLVNAVVASIDGKALTLRDLRIYENGRGRLLPAAQRRTRDDFLNGMIEEALLQAEFERQNIHADDEDTQYYIERTLEMNRSSRADVDRALSEIGLQWSDYFERMRMEVQKLAVINREIRARVHVTEEEIERYWRESSEYVSPPGYEISQIYLELPVSSDSQATEAVWSRAREAYEAVGKSGFGRAAKSYSEGPTAKEGGALGSFAKGTLATEFEARIDGLSAGQYTEPFEEGGGVHILRLDRVSTGRRAELDDALKGEIRERLYDDLLDQRLRRWIDEDLRKQHHVTVRIGHLGKHVKDSVSARGGT